MIVNYGGKDNESSLSACSLFFVKFSLKFLINSL